MKFERNALAFDLIYTPEETIFLKVARDCGLLTVGGLGMLMDQAIAAFEIWIAPLKSKELLRKDLRRYLKGLLRTRENPAPLFLTGFMGVGKSTVGAELSKITGRLFIDTDQLIESIVGHSIQTVFAVQGEAQFRKFEKNAVKEAVQMKNVIVALGGGAILDEENLELVSSKGNLICLQADEQTLEKRIAEQGIERPLLENLETVDRRAKIALLLQARKAIYDRAHFAVSTMNRNPREVAFAVLSQLGDLQ